MCLHPKNRTSDVNKIAEELNNFYTNFDPLNEFAKACNYVETIAELNSINQDLITLHINIRSLIHKQEDLKSLLNNFDVDVCSINETWLTKENKGLVKVPSYTYEGVERTRKIGGGVGFLIRDTLNYKCCLDLEISLKDMELCVIKLMSIEHNVIICSIYRAPKL